VSGDAGHGARGGSGGCGGPGAYARDVPAAGVLDGRAFVYCEGAFDTPNGKTAHGLVRFTHRYDVVAVIDSRHAGRDAREVLDGTATGIPVVADVDAALALPAATTGDAPRPTHLVVGLAPDGGRLDARARADLARAIERGLHVDCGLHDFLIEDPELAALAARHGVRLRDVRKPPPRSALHFFSGKIESVGALKIAILGTDSAVGKRTTAWLLVEGLRAAGHTAEMVGTGQTAWMQGVRFGIIMDSLVNDFVSGEIEHAVWSAWEDSRPEVIVIEGQGSLMNPAYPGGFEILAAGRPDCVVLQHAPARRDYDGFPGYPIHPLPRQIQVVELLSDRPVIAVTINHEGIARPDLGQVCARVAAEAGVPAHDVLADGPQGLVAQVAALLSEREAVS
jgi:uncharacterized NAD-dependent epimerase/dehydratase family protein